MNCYAVSNRKVNFIVICEVNRKNVSIQSIGNHTNWPGRITDNRNSARVGNASRSESRATLGTTVQKRLLKNISVFDILPPSV